MPNLLDKESPLTLRDREIVILRICANNRCEYEWGVHVAIFAKHAKLSPEQVADTCSLNPDGTIWSERELCLLRALDGLCNQGSIDENTLDQFQATWSKPEQLEIFALSGAYHTVSFISNNSDLALEDFAERFPTTV